MCHKIFSITILLCTLSITAASAQSEKVFTNDPIVITASRYETSVSKEGKDISIVTEEDIKKSGKKNLSEVLETVPGVTIVRKGADGGLTNVYLRGSKSGNVLIMIDGVKVYDPTAVGNVYDISGIMTSNIERIEIVKGSMSSMYGAEASGGVINIITKKGIGQKITVAGEAGAYRTFSESVSFSDSTEKSSIFFSGAHYKTAGISSAKENNSAEDFEDDGYENISASGKMSSKITDKASVDFTMNYTDSKTDIDDGCLEDDPNRIYTNKLFTSSAGFKHSPFQWWTYKTGVSYMSFTREDVDSADSVDTMENDVYSFNGSNAGLELINIFRIMDWNVLTAGFEVLQEKGKTESAYYDSWAMPAGFAVNIFEEEEVFTKSFFIHDEISIADIFTYNLGARVDDNNEFGSHITYDTSAALIIPVTGTKLKASVGTGFRAPTLYELYDGVNGNEDLDPEKSFVYDAGVYQEMFDGKLSADFTYFTQKYEDMIIWIPSMYDNVDGNVTNHGVEIAAGFKPVDLIDLRYSYTYTKFDETDVQDATLKRPRHKHSASLTLKPVDSLNINVSYLYVSEREDAYFDATTYSKTYVKLDAYHKFDMNIRYALNEVIALTFRGENLTDADYEETYGYSTKGRGFYGGAEIVL